MVWPKRLKQNIEPETFMLRDATTSCQFLVTPLSCARTSQRRCPVQHSMVACIQQSPTASLLTLIIPDTTSQKVTNPHLSLCSSLIPSTLMRPQFRVARVHIQASTHEFVQIPWGCPLASHMPKLHAAMQHALGDSECPSGRFECATGNMLTREQKDTNAVSKGWLNAEDHQDQSKNHHSRL